MIIVILGYEFNLVVLFDKMFIYKCVVSDVLESI